MPAKLILALALALSATAAEPTYRRLSAKEFHDKLLAGWTGQMVGAAWGMPLEFQFNGEIVPESRVPTWDPAMINDSLTNDDTFRDAQLLYLLEKCGLDITPRQATIESALYWRPPGSLLLSGYYSPGRGSGFSLLSGDGIGLIAPGLPNAALALSEQLSAGRASERLYAGQWLIGMYAEAFFEKSPEKLIQAGLRLIPASSKTAESIRDLVRWHDEDPHDWQEAWHLMMKKWRGIGPSFRVGGPSTPAGMYADALDVALGLLYGNADLDKSMLITIRAGDGTDTTTPNVGGLLFTTLGYAKIPERFKAPIEDAKLTYLFDYNAWQRRPKGPYTFREIIDVSDRLARQLIVKSGGRIEKDSAGNETFLLPVTEPKPSKLAPSDTQPKPEPLTKEELARLRGTGSSAAAALKQWAPGWTLSGGCDLGLAPEIYGKTNIITTYPPDKQTPCTLTRRLEIPGGDWQTTLEVVVSSARDGGYDLVVNVDGKEVFLKHAWSRWANPNKPWMHAYVDLTPFRGKLVTIDLVNKPHPS